MDSKYFHDIIFPRQGLSVFCSFRQPFCNTYRIRRITLMKKLATLVLAMAMLAASASAVGALAPERTTNIDIPKVGEAVPVIDGKIDPAEGWGDPLVSLDADNMKGYLTRQDDGATWDAESVKGYYRWDEECFYFACEVVDPQHHNENYDGGSWAGDSIRFDIKTNLASDDLNDTMKYWFSLNNDGFVGLFQEKAEGEVPINLGEFTAKAFMVVRDEDTKTTTYELAMLWAENMLDPTQIKPGFEFITAQRVMEMSSDDAEPDMSIQLCGYNVEADATKWFQAKLVDAPAAAVEEVSAEEPAVEEAPAEEPVVEEAPVEEPVVEEAPAEEPVVEEIPVEEPAAEPVEEIVEPAPQTFDAGVIAAVAAAVSALGYVFTRKR